MATKRLEEEKELFCAYLRQNGLKKTHQKDLILETFLAHEGHMSVEEVYALVKRKDKKIGIVTVFRTLKSLKDCGIAKEIILDDDLTRFEHCYRHPIHHHIICRTCKKVIEFVSPELEKVQKSIVDRYKFEQNDQRIQLYGICQDCREERKPQTDPTADTQKVFARDAFRMAIAMQRQGVEFYRRAAAHNQDPAGKAIFERIMAEEEDRAQKLERQLEELHKQEKGLEQAPVFLHFNFDELQHLMPCLQASVVGGEMLMDARRALEVAIQLETQAAAFFREYAEKFGDTEGKRVLESFAEMVMKHGASMRGQAQTMATARVRSGD
jgi:Fur family transcriptional regulator, ferric uptake regulator